MKLNQATDVSLQRFRSLATLTLAAVYFLILVGASVRASGAGMGCPDWPTCFGQWIPPTHESQLPADYQQTYAKLGYAETRFNVVKTWTEYLNRLLGVSIGVLIFLSAIVSLPLRRLNASIPKASVAAFLMVGFQGWLGSRVVSSNLQPGMITLHMLMALAIVATLLYALAQSRRSMMAAQPVTAIDPRFEKWLYIVLAMTVLQVVMGTQVREMTDYIKESQGEAMRASWIEAMPWFFYVHRSFSALVLLSNIWLARLLVNSLGWMHVITRLTFSMIAVIGLSVLSGATLGHLGMPALVQPAHLLAATLLFGLQFLIWMSYRHARDSHKQLTTRRKARLPDPGHIAAAV
ncbi:MAG: heme A synthase [Gammaproteobacteria bacterium]|nr:heme A synthase [Gammaproteobacteria bacterium]HBW82701.1 heme A synthase [Gammaproteobacteria bacterium]|tara:strand:+ start:4520 stop:5566 length:1047 start_codon:yes stop_codon:yes gene_type:complete